MSKDAQAMTVIPCGALPVKQVEISGEMAFASRALKVNHAGEHGAVNIYAGQIFAARLTAPDLVPVLREFRSHEARHRAIFESELVRRKQRRCRSYQLCGIGGFVLGLVTGILGRRAIAATTVAVERVVLDHLAHQVSVLRGRDPEATLAIASIIEEEQQHRDHLAILCVAGGSWLARLTSVVAGCTELVIWLGMRRSLGNFGSPARATGESPW